MIRLGEYCRESGESIGLVSRESGANEESGKREVVNIG